VTSASRRWGPASPHSKRWSATCARLGTNATNSGTPPSANSPDAPKPVTKAPTGKRPGAQPGHPAHLKRRLPPERLTRTIAYGPRHCERCRQPLPADRRPGDPDPSWHPVAELPPVTATVTEYQGHYRTCPGWGARNHAPIPATLKAHSVGPRLAAALAYDLKKCIGEKECGLRLKECPESALSVPPSDGKVRVNWDLCTNCGKCVPVCPPKALYLLGQEMTVDQVLEKVERDGTFYRGPGGGITLAGGECLLQADFSAALLEEAHERGINTA
jgi:ferredoxin